MRVAIASLLLLGCAAGPHRGPPISTGSEDLDRTRAAVVFLSSDCSGALVAPDVVLTAAHCVLGQDAPPAVHVWRGAERWSSATSRCAVHPDATRSGSELCDETDGETSRAHDLAVLHLASAVPATLAEPLPILIAPPVEGRTDWWRGRVVRVVGWHRRPAVVGAARRYSGENVISSLRGPVLTAMPRDRSGFTTRVGASGGPALLDVGGREHVVGVLFGGERSDSRDSIYAATFSTENASWLVRVAREAFAPDSIDPSSPRFSE